MPYLNRGFRTDFGEGRKPPLICRSCASASQFLACCNCAGPKDAVVLVGTATRRLQKFAHVRFIYMRMNMPSLAERFCVFICTRLLDFSRVLEQDLFHRGAQRFARTLPASCTAGAMRIFGGHIIRLSRADLAGPFSIRASGQVPSAGQLQPLLTLPAGISDLRCTQGIFCLSFSCDCMCLWERRATGTSGASHWLNFAPAFTSAWAALALNFSTKTRAWGHKCAFQRNNCDHACYDSDAEAYSSI